MAQTLPSPDLIATKTNKPGKSYSATGAGLYTFFNEEYAAIYGRLVGGTYTVNCFDLYLGGTERITSDGDAQVRGIYSAGTTGSIPSGFSGIGSFFAYYPGKQAIYGGTWTSASGSGSGLIDANIGVRSFAMGYDVTASGSTSFAFGQSATASGDDFSLALGNAVTASDEGACAIGTTTTATNSYGASFGHNLTNAGSYGIALGYSASIGVTHSRAVVIGTGGATPEVLASVAADTVSIGCGSTAPSIHLISGSGATPGRVGIYGTTSPTAQLHFAAGTAAASTAPIKLTAGTNLTSPEAGAIEYDGTNLYYTDGTNTRQTIATGASSYVTLQGASPGSADTGNFNISGVGIVDSLVVGGSSGSVGLAELSAGVALITDAAAGSEDLAIMDRLYFDGVTTNNSIDGGTTNGRFYFYGAGVQGAGFLYHAGTRSTWSTLYDSSIATSSAYNGANYIHIGAGPAAPSGANAHHILLPSASEVLWHDATSTASAYASNTIDAGLARNATEIVGVVRDAAGNPGDLHARTVRTDTPVAGCCYVSTAVAQTIATGAGWTNALNDGASPATTTAVLASEFTHTSPGRLVYTGSDPRWFFVHFAIDITPASSTGIVWDWAFYVYDDSAASGAIDASTTISRRTASTTVGAAAVSGLIQLDTNDYIELHAKHDNGSAQDVTVAGNLSVFPVL